MSLAKLLLAFLGRAEEDEQRPADCIAGTAIFIARCFSNISLEKKRDERVERTLIDDGSQLNRGNSNWSNRKSRKLQPKARY